MKQILKQTYFLSKSRQKINKNGNRIHETMRNVKKDMLVHIVRKKQGLLYTFTRHLNIHFNF